MKKVLVIVAAMIVIMGLSVSVYAQDAIAGGDIITNEMTEDAFEFTYNFDANEGELVVFRMTGIDPFDGFSEPVLQINAPTGDKIRDTEELFQTFGTYGEEFIFYVPTATATYSVTATRVGGADGEGLGEFELEMLVPPQLVVGEPVDGTVSSEGGHDVYTITPEDSIVFYYARTAGEYGPELAINVLNDDGELQGIGYVTGDLMTFGGIGEFAAGETYIITVGEPTLSFSFFFDEVTADYNLEVDSFPGE